MILREKYYVVLAFCAAFISTANSKPSIPISVIGEHFKDVTNKDSGEDILQAKQKEETLKEAEETLKDHSKNEVTELKDIASHEKKDIEKKAHEISDAYEGQNHKVDKAENSEQNGFKKGHKKGHHNQGFHNSYHKDESSNKSTFFDDFNDEGDQARFNSRHASHDDAGGRKYYGSTRDGSEYIRNDLHDGGHKRIGSTGIQERDRHNYDRNKYLDDKLAYDQHRKGHSAHDSGQHYERELPRHPGLGPGFDRPNFREFDRPGWDEPHYKGRFAHDDWGGPGYYGDDGFRHEGGYGSGPGHGFGYRSDRADYLDESRPLPVAAEKGAPLVHRRQTITIYEDPRYEDASSGQLRRANAPSATTNGGAVSLDVRPSSQRYARYDDEYYAPAQRDAAASSGGAVQSSKINRLVYYRRE